MISQRKIILSGISNNIGEFAKGKLSIVNKSEDVRTIKKGNIAIIKKKSFGSDSLQVVYSSIKHGASGIILEEGSLTDHGVIAAKELHIPMLITKDMVNLGNHEKEYILFKTEVYDGGIPPRIKLSLPSSHLKTHHKVKLNLGFPLTLRLYPEIADLVDGVAFCRLEFTLMEILGGLHPKIFLENNSLQILSKKLSLALKPLVFAFKDKPVWFRTDDFSAEQLLEMKGGKRYESRELNSMMGWRGIRRSIQEKTLLKAQFGALKILINEGYKNIGVFPPMAICLAEYKEWLKIAHSCGLEKGARFGLMVETPAAAITIQDFIPFISFVVFGTNDLTQFTLALDRNNPKTQTLFDERNPAVLYLLKSVINACRKKDIETSIGGQAGSDVAFLSLMLDYGISGTSVNPDLDSITNVRSYIHSYEKKRK